MNCRFCNVPMLPIEDIVPDSDQQFEHSMWECHNCPATVKQYTSDPSWFSILAFYNGHWYEVMQMYVPEGNHKDPPLLSIYKYTIYLNDLGKPNIRSELAQEHSFDGRITPQNIKDKLATFLVFS